MSKEGKTTVLFLCVENSCRSQIAEGLARALGGGLLEPASAGSRPSGRVNPTAVELMRRRGVDISQQASKGVPDLPPGRWDYVVTMGCGDACPFVPAKAQLDWRIPDPKDLPPAEFDAVIGMIEEKVRDLVSHVARATPT